MNLTKIISTLLLMGAVLAYTIYNYVAGKTTLTMFLVFVVILGVPFANMINILIQELRKK